MANTDNQPTTVPGNMAGTLAGAAATLAVGWLTNAGYLAIIASATGLPVASIGIVAMTIIGGAVNYGVSHYAGIKKINDLYDMIPTIKTYSSPSDYPSENKQ